jgi:hypothetical protein
MMDEQASIPLVPPTPPVVELAQPPTRRPVVVTVLVIFLMVASVLFDLWLIPLCYYALDGLPNFAHDDYRWVNVFILLLFLSVLCLCMVAANLLRRREWARKMALVLVTLISICMDVIFCTIAFMNLPSALGAGTTIILGIGIIIVLCLPPLIVLTRPTVKAWFNTRQ